MMLKINRLRIEIKTESGLFGFDDTFSPGMNFISSDDNTCGKSSIISAIYYALGVEEIIGGKGEKVLTSVYKSNIEDGNELKKVLESGVYLEISNGNEIVTIYRSAKHHIRMSSLVSIYYSSMEDIKKPSVHCEDMYVHMPNSTVNEKGFHTFLEKFLLLDLPLVPTSDEGVRKLYLQLIFSALFIEQKHGWSGVLSGMPYLGIKDSKKRILEYILGLETLENEKKKTALRTQELKIKRDWDEVIKEFLIKIESHDCIVNGVPLIPTILYDSDYISMHLNKKGILLEEYIETLNNEYIELNQVSTNEIENLNEIQEELSELENLASSYEREQKLVRNSMNSVKTSIEILNNNIKMIEDDIRNNKDAIRLRKLGSEINLYTASDLCPTCNQSIDDSLITHEHGLNVMSIEDNIRHLEAQKEMLEFSLKSNIDKSELDKKFLNDLEKKLYKVRSLSRALRNDIYSVNSMVSETKVYKKFSLEQEINTLKALLDDLDLLKSSIRALSEEWKNYLLENENTVFKKFTDLDEEKLKSLEAFFVNNLTSFGYKSIYDLNTVAISRESYLPTVEDFDMKFDSSASDNIRAIWAFILALFQTSNKLKGNHPAILIFDEPAQHSIVPDDMSKFFREIMNITNCQVIVGITVKDIGIQTIVKNLPSTKYKNILIPNKAFKRI